MVPTDPFYSIYGVDEKTFAPIKVVWGRVANRVAAAVLRDQRNPWSPHTVAIPFEAMMVPCSNEAEAFFLCGCLNSCISNAIVSGSIVLHPDTHVLKRVRIPRFDSASRIHRLVADGARECHEAVESENLQRLPVLEQRLDENTARLWDLNDGELTAIQEGLAMTTRKKGISEQEEDD